MNRALHRTQSIDMALRMLANCWKETFSSEKDPLFFYTMPDRQIAPKITRPDGIKGKSFALPIQYWLEDARAHPKQAGKQLLGILDAVMKEAY